MVALTAETLAPTTDGTVDVVGLAERLRSRLDQFVVDAQAAVMEQVPAYRENDRAVLRGEVATNCAHVFEVFLDTLAVGRTPAPADFPMSAGYAARRAEAGISLEDFLQAFRVGQAVLWEHIRTVAAGQRGGPAAALAVVGHLMATVEAGSSAAARGYVEATNLRMADTARVERDLVEDLLAGRTALAQSRTEVLDTAGLLRTSGVLVGVAMPLDPAEGTPHVREAADLVSRAVAQTVGGVVVVRQDEIVAVVPADPFGEATVLSRLTQLTEALAGRGLPVAFGFSTVRDGLAEVPAAYREAELARAMQGDRTGLRALSSLSTLDYLVARPDDSARQLIRPAVRAFIEEDSRAGGLYVETLLSYVAADLNAKAAAASLHVHVNTVYYRLDRICERTGHDLRRLDEVIELLLAVRLLTG